MKWYGDHVKCCNCDFIGAVDIGEDVCPQCKFEGALTWVDEQNQEIEVDIYGNIL